jgi:hypothetical protein
MLVCFVFCLLVVVRGCYRLLLLRVGVVCCVLVSGFVLGCLLVVMVVTMSWVFCMVWLSVNSHL